MRPAAIRRAAAGAAALTVALFVAAPASADRSRATNRPGATSAGLGFELVRSRVSPKKAYFAGKRRVRLRYRFSSSRPVDLRIAVVRPGSGRAVATWRQRKARPGTPLERRWNGITRRGRAARDGRYEFRVGAKGRPLRYAGRFRLRGHAFPVDGAHGSRGAVGEFGAARNGGRTHEGYDILADCGTPLVAARGGRVRKVGYDPRLYGHFLLINGRKTNETYFYSHLISSPRVRKGERVRTAQRVGEVGQTGNARSTPCHLHFELRRDGRPIDPWPRLRRWDRWS